VAKPEGVRIRGSAEAGSGGWERVQRLRGSAEAGRG